MTLCTVQLQIGCVVSAASRCRPGRVLTRDGLSYKLPAGQRDVLAFLHMARRETRDPRARCPHHRRAGGEGRCARRRSEGCGWRRSPGHGHAKMLRLELLKVKADLERELEDFSLNCSRWASTFTGSAVSASRPVIGRTESPRRTGSRQFDNHERPRLGSGAPVFVNVHGNRSSPRVAVPSRQRCPT